jgi:tRNA threonylcarbamoyladenosine biosynthesis protein TsaB
MNANSENSMKTMKILSIDTALSGCSVSVYEACAGKGDSESLINATLPEDMNRGQAERLVPMINDLLEQSGVSYAQLGAIAVTNGPGAFTGLRIGLSTARALALALDIPVIGFSTLDVMYKNYCARAQPQNGQTLLALIETKRDDYYACMWNAQGECVMDAQAISLAALTPLLGQHEAGLIIGDATSRFLSETAEGVGTWRSDDNFTKISTQTLARMADGYMQENLLTGHKVINAAPQYLRGADVSISKKTYKTIEQ